MAYSLAQSPTVANGGGAANISKAFASTVTAHSLLVAFATTDAATPGTFSATGGGTWASIGSIKEPGSTQWLAILYCLDATGGTAPTVQVSWTGNGSFNGLIIAEYTNAGAASLLDANTAGRLVSAGTTSNPADNAMTAAGAGELGVSWLVSAAATTITAASGATITQNDTTDVAAAEHNLNAGSGSVTMSFTVTGTPAVAIISALFKVAGGAAAVIPNVNMAPIAAY